MGVILFDIDGTLFDSKKFGELIRAEFMQILGVTEEELIRANADYYSRLETTADFNPHDISSHLAQAFGGSQEDLERVFWENESIYKDAVYEDVLDSLKKASKENILGVFSQGNPQLQERKLVAGGIRKYFEGEIFIHSRKLTDEAVALLPRDATLVDNDHAIIEAMKSFVKPIWINRNTQDSDSEITTIHSLSELQVISN